MSSVKKTTPKIQKKTKTSKVVGKTVQLKTEKKQSPKTGLTTKNGKEKPKKNGKRNAAPQSKKKVTDGKTPTKKRATNNTKRTPSTVVVPNNVPLRSIEKAELIRSELSLYWQKSIHRIAIVSGLCFLLLGSTYAGVNVFGTTPHVEHRAEVISALSEPVINTELMVLSNVPDVLSQQLQIMFTLNNVYSQSVEYYVQNVNTQYVSEKKAVDYIPDNKYVFTLLPEKLQAGEYKLYILYSKEGELTNGSAATKAEVIAQFTVPESEAQAVVKETTRSQESNTQTVQQTTEASPEEIIVEEGSDTIPQRTEEQLVTENNQESLSDSTNKTRSIQTVKTLTNEEPRVLLEEKPVSELSREEKPTEGRADTKFTLKTQDTTVSGLLTVGVDATDFTDLKLYARPVASLNSQFLTTARDKAGSKTFIVSTEPFLPNGTYEFYARGKDSTGLERTTPSVLITVKNTSPKPTTSTTSEAQKLADNSNEQTPTQEERAFAPINLEEQSSGATTTTAVQEATKQLLNQNTESIKQLLNNYASARQSGNEILVKAAQEALVKKGDELANVALLDNRLSGISDDVTLEVIQRFVDLQDNVDTFEQIRKEKSNGRSALDTDGDGIPDFDEINLYKTNPNEPDTDGDGFADGVEIVRGFDPLDDVPQAVVTFESPKESVGLVQADVLKIEEVVPIVNSIANQNDSTVRAQISGRALPNSFVTLYIYSTPTIVTIKTDADGSFVYTLDKELPDGTHDVFVALTDNTGSIVAQSNPFSFIKEAQAFTPVDAAGGDVVGADSNINTAATNSYNAVVGVGVLAFGLILIMLGLSLRTKDEELILNTESVSSKKGTDTTAEATPAKILS